MIATLTCFTSFWKPWRATDLTNIVLDIKILLIFFRCANHLQKKQINFTEMFIFFPFLSIALNKIEWKTNLVMNCMNRSLLLFIFWRWCKSFRRKRNNLISLTEVHRQIFTYIIHLLDLFSLSSQDHMKRFCICLR